VVYATVTISDSLYCRLRGDPNALGNLVWSRCQKTSSMKVPALVIGWRTGFLGGILLVLILVWAFFHRQINRPLVVHLLLNSDSPREEFFGETVRESSDPVDFLNRCWATGKVAHRQLVAALLKDMAQTNPPWFARAEPLVLAGTTDGDASVRELALAALEASRSPRLFESASAQVADLDPMVRLLGLDYLRKADPQRAVPVVMQLLDDTDPRVVAGAEGALMRWSGEDYGVRARLAIAPQEGLHPGQLDAANADTIRRGVERRKAWWKLHAKDYAASPEGFGVTVTNGAARLPIPDFTLKDLNGRTVHLEQFRGKVVLLNFWATWCTACLAEIPDLIALQNKLGDQVAILGVALDGVPDEHGHVPGEEESGTTDRREPSMANARAKVLRAVKARGINYTVFWDPKSSLEAQFNGGELPTTVIIDAEGRMRRRFIGERNLTVFQAMIGEAASPAIKN
jgi:thiol-disulfide isomerase/thioredoxin